MNQNQWAILDTEWTTDPAALGITAIRAAIPTRQEERSAEWIAANAGPVADAYNAARTAYVSAIQTQWPLFEAAMNTARPAADRELITASELFEAIEASEYAALAAAEQKQVDLILGLGDSIQVGPSTRARAWLIGAFGAGTTTRANMLAIVSGLTQTRHEELGLPAIKMGWLDTLVKRNP